MFVWTELSFLLWNPEEWISGHKVWILNLPGNLQIGFQSACTILTRPQVFGTQVSADKTTGGKWQSTGKRDVLLRGPEAQFHGMCCCGSNLGSCVAVRSCCPLTMIFVYLISSGVSSLGTASPSHFPAVSRGPALTDRHWDGKGWFRNTVRCTLFYVQILLGQDSPLMSLYHVSASVDFHNMHMI